MNFAEFPFGVPQTVKNAEKINDILKTSFHMQGTLRVTNACAIVNLVLNRCLEAVGVKATLVYGVHQPNGVIDPEGIHLPHVWLNIEGNIVDNTSVEDIPQLIFIKTKRFGKYTQKSVQDTDSLYMGDHVTKQHGIVDHDVSQFEWLLSNSNKALALSRNKNQLDQYFRLMIQYVFSKFKEEVNDISESVFNNCWNCNKSDPSLKVCSACKVSKYCSRICQKKDRKNHKTVCLPPNSY